MSVSQGGCKNITLWFAITEFHKGNVPKLRNKWPQSYNKMRDESPKGKWEKWKQMKKKIKLIIYQDSVLLTSIWTRLRNCKNLQDYEPA